MTKLLTLFGSVMLFLALHPSHTEADYTLASVASSEISIPSFEGDIQFAWEHPAFVSVGKQIKEARNQNGLTIEALALQIDLTPKQLMTIELGDATPTRDIVQEIEQRLNCEIILDGYFK